MQLLRQTTGVTIMYVRNVVFALLVFTFSLAHSQIPTIDNDKLLLEISTFGSLLKSDDASARDLRQLIAMIDESEDISYETKVNAQTLLTRAYRNASDERAVDKDIAETMSIVRVGKINQNPSLVANNSDKPLILQTPPPVSSQNIPYTPYPNYLGFNYKDPLEFCDVTSLADQVLNTNYKDLNLQLRQRFKDRTLDQIAELIIHQRAIDMASYATMTSAAAYGASMAAYYLPAAAGGADRSLKLVGGRLTVVTGAAVVATTLMYLDVCSYAQQNARMIFQLADLYDTGTFYTTDEKQKFAWQVLLYSMGGKVAGKFALEYQTTRNIGTLSRDIYYSVLSRGGNFFRGIFEQVSFGIKSGALKAEAQKLPTIGPDSPLEPVGPRPSNPGGNLPPPPQAPSPTPGGPTPNRPTFPPMPGQPTPGWPGQPGQPGQPIELEITKVSPWALLGIPANGALTYYSMKGVGNVALKYIKSEREKVYSLPMQHEFAQEAIFKVLIYAAVATEVESRSGSEVSKQQQGPVNPLQPVNPLNPNPGVPPSPGTQPTTPPPPVVTPAVKTVRSPVMRSFIEMVYSKYNPNLGINSDLYRKIQAEMNEYNSAIPQEITVVFNEELNSVPVKRALLRLIIEMLYQDRRFDFNDRKVIRSIQVNVLGLQDPNFTDLILRDITEEGLRYESLPQQR